MQEAERWKIRPPPGPPRAFLRLSIARPVNWSLWRARQAHRDPRGSSLDVGLPQGLPLPSRIVRRGAGRANGRDGKGLGVGPNGPGTDNAGHISDSPDKAR